MTKRGREIIDAINLLLYKLRNISDEAKKRLPSDLYGQICVLTIHTRALKICSKCEANIQHFITNKAKKNASAYEIVYSYQQIHIQTVIYSYTYVYINVCVQKGRHRAKYNRYISTLAELALAFLLIYGLLSSKWSDESEHCATERVATTSTLLQVLQSFLRFFAIYSIRFGLSCCLQQRKTLSETLNKSFCTNAARELVEICTF